MVTPRKNLHLAPEVLYRAGHPERLCPGKDERSEPDTLHNATDNDSTFPPLVKTHKVY
jgi:hypothetical protein